MFILEYIVGTDSTPRFAEGGSESAIKAQVRQDHAGQPLSFGVSAVRVDRVHLFPAFAARLQASRL